MRHVGLIGLGAMGLPMARTLAGAGFNVSGFDASAARRALFQGAVETIEALADRDIFVLSLPNDATVADVVHDLMAIAKDGATIIDTSTVAPDTTRRLQAAAATRGLGYVDAPVSGGAAGAADGTLLVMAGGSTAALEAARPVLDALARKIVPCGGPGAGNVVKLINNVLCAGHLLLAGEALRIARSGAVAPADLVEALNAGSGRSAVTEVNLPRWVLSNTFDSNFTMALMTKDVELAAELDGAGAIACAVAAHWRTALAELGGGEDFNRIIEVEPT
ncbi:MAG: NAD(P)-dependent oxidoreductase [Hyphomicrobiaceae bacterium]